MECILDAKSLVGEGPAWDSQSETLLWVDIEGRELHRFDPRRRRDQVVRLPEYIGAAVPRASGGVVAALRDGFYHVDLDTQAVILLAKVPQTGTDHRFNDGKCDALGRFWAGTLPLSQDRPTGVLYCLEPDLTVRPVIDGLTISNGLGWSPDHRVMYLIDSAVRSVTAYDYDLASGAPSGGRTIIEIEDGIPDGLAVDVEGMLWVAHWGTWRLSRWDPRTGDRLQEFGLPVSQVTSLAFGGPDLRNIYVTSARLGLSPADCEAQPYAGGLFELPAPVPGLPTMSFAG